MISKAEIGNLTQGTLFSCAVAEDYPGKQVSGLVITARCDITNDKAEVYNYIPVVSFKDWVEGDGARIIAGRVEKAASGDMRQRLKQLDFAPSVLETLSPSQVYERLFKETDSAKVRSQAAAFKASVDRYEVAAKCLGYGAHEAAIKNLLQGEKKEAEKLIKELCQNAVAEAYFLGGVSPGEDCDGYVALLREIRHIPRTLAAAIAAGLDQQGLNAICDADHRQRNRLHIGPDDFAWPTGVLSSPFIEHLMQRLTFLFSRIGVTDVDSKTMARLSAVINFNESLSDKP